MEICSEDTVYVNQNQGAEIYMSNDMCIAVWWYPPNLVTNFMHLTPLELSKSADIYMLGCTLLELFHVGKFTPFKEHINESPSDRQFYPNLITAKNQRYGVTKFCRRKGIDNLKIAWLIFSCLEPVENARLRIEDILKIKRESEDSVKFHDYLKEVEMNGIAVGDYQHRVDTQDVDYRRAALPISLPISTSSVKSSQTRKNYLKLCGIVLWKIVTICFLLLLLFAGFAWYYKVDDDLGTVTTPSPNPPNSTTLRSTLTPVETCSLITNSSALIKLQESDGSWQNFKNIKIFFTKGVIKEINLWFDSQRDRKVTTSLALVLLTHCFAESLAINEVIHTGVSALRNMNYKRGEGYYDYLTRAASAVAPGQIDVNKLISGLEE